MGPVGAIMGVESCIPRNPGVVTAWRESGMKSRWAAWAVVMTCAAAAGQSPIAYTVTTKKPMVSPGTVTITYRLGKKVLVDESTSPQEVSGSHIIRSKTFFDLDKKESIMWDPANPAAPCVVGSFSKDWGDPFGGAASLTGPKATQIGSAIVNGFTTSVLDAPNQGGSTRVWVDAQTGLVVKAERVPLAGDPIQLMEVTAVSLAAPPASVFEVPSRCGEGGAETSVQPAASGTAAAGADAIAALTGENSRDFVSATTGPASPKSCGMVFRIVKAGSLEPVNGAYQVAADLKLETEKNPHYNIGQSADGRATFSGGALQEIAPEGNTGVFRVANLPEQFEIDVEFGDAGSAATKIYRQCFAPQTVLLFVARDPTNLSAGGGWMWAKSGRLATIPR